MTGRDRSAHLPLFRSARSGPGDGLGFVRIQGVRGEVDDGSGQVLGYWEIAGLKPPAVQAGLNRMEGGNRTSRPGGPGTFRPLLGRLGDC